MAEKKAQIVIKKVKKGGHGGAHGGAWKVAYADFVTAMMCFFLVMWLMGADEATKASISAYFNNPSSPESWRPDLHDKDAIPLGNQTGAGDTVLNGAEGDVPEDLVQRPMPVIVRKPDSEGTVEADGNLAAEAIKRAESITFPFKESELFEKDDPEIAKARAKGPLELIRKVAKTFQGTLVIRTQYSDGPASGDEMELQNSRLVALRHHLVENRWLDDDLITTSVSKAPPVRSALRPERRIEFTFMK